VIYSYNEPVSLKMRARVSFEQSNENDSSAMSFDSHTAGLRPFRGPAAFPKSQAVVRSHSRLLTHLLSLLPLLQRQVDLGHPLGFDLIRQTKKCL
jgi:hypothetical protein